MALNVNIRKLREDKHLTQQQLADRLYVSRQTVCRWENGSRCPDLITAKKLALELDSSLDDLISDEDIHNSQMEQTGMMYRKFKNRQKLQKFQKKLLGFIQLVGSVFMAVTVLLKFKAHMSVPVWFTVSCFCAVGGALFFYWVTDRKLKNAERL